MLEREELLFIGQLMSLVVCSGSMTLIQILFTGFLTRDFRLLEKVLVRRFG
jgi:hypothetical protein